MRLHIFNNSQSFGLVAVTLFFIIIVFLLSESGVYADTETHTHEHDEFLNVDLSWPDDEDPRRTQVLSRKRRYLTFPSGSSFQLVYDLIVGVVDYTNYLILGVTSALAWPLPTGPPSELLDQLTERLKEGPLVRNDTIENIQYVDTKPRKPAYLTSSVSQSYDNSQYDSYYSSNRFHPPMHTEYYSSNPAYFSNPGNTYQRKDDPSYYSKRPNPFTEWKDSKIRKVSPTYVVPPKPSTYSSKWSEWWNSGKRPYKKRTKFYPKHRIYPVFAKRSIHNRQKRHGIPTGSKLSKIDKIHLRYHRSSRHDLYKRIEKYLETHNRNGHECVLKALCETGQKTNEVEPGSFVGEIMRAIFTMPEPEDDEPVRIYKHQLYDDAHAHQGNCTDKFPKCPESLWEADFIF